MVSFIIQIITQLHNSYLFFNITFILAGVFLELSQREKFCDNFRISGRSFGPNFGFPYIFYTFSLLPQLKIGRRQPAFLPDRPLGWPLFSSLQYVWLWPYACPCVCLCTCVSECVSVCVHVCLSLFMCVLSLCPPTYEQRDISILVRIPLALAYTFLSAEYPVNQGPVVQRVVSLTCTAKATHIFFSKKFQHICVSLDVNFNESLTNIFSFEQLGPEVGFLPNSWIYNWDITKNRLDFGDLYLIFKVVAGEKLKINSWGTSVFSESTITR